MRLFSLITLLAPLPLVLASCGSPPPRPHVILISLDTLRYDALGPSSSGPSVTPHLDRFREDAVLFTRAFAPIPFTLPSHMSLFTGLSPDVHRVSAHDRRLSRDIKTLGELLKEAHYTTVGFVTNEWLNHDFGFGRGFDLYHRLRHRLTYADRVNAMAKGTLRFSRGISKPVFLFLHYMDPHSDFYWDGQNTLPYYSPPHTGSSWHGEDDSYCDREGHCATAFLQNADRQQRRLDAAEIEEILQLYREGIRYLDGQLGELFDWLQERGTYESSLIVVTSDHGEEFREHGQFLHTQTYDETIAVPLLIKFPNGQFAGRRVDHLAQTADVLPTLLDTLDLPIPGYVQGKSLLPAITAPQSTRGVAIAQDVARPRRYALRTPHHKLILDLDTEEQELYDLDNDPGERTNLGPTGPNPELTQRLRRQLMDALAENRRLAATLNKNSAGEGSTLSQEDRARLRALGYL